MTTNTEALLQLRRVVEDAPDDRFDMTVFGEYTHGCGTACCAAGWAVLDPWFEKSTEIRRLFDVSTDGDVVLGITPQDYTKTFPGLAAVFGISQADAEAMFNANTVYAEKWEVLDNVDRVLEGVPAIPYTEDDF